MVFFVEDRTREETRECRKHFACLKEGTVSRCRVLAALEGETLFVQCRESGPCAHRETRGERVTCACPTRVRIYERYGV